MAVVNAFYCLRCNSLQLINTASILLIPKKEGVNTVQDFRPISLIHSFIKIITKATTLRLQPHMNSIVSKCQSAFIKKRSIHDNFMSVRNTARRYHRDKVPAVFLKLDIAKAFDSIRWDYLLLLLHRLGFPTRWCDWTAVILSTSSSRILLNGIPNPPIKHGRGLRQGDPLSRLLFVIAINTLQRILELATDMNIFTKLRERVPLCRISMYGDDATLFIEPRKEELDALANILELFGEATGLKTNFHKSTAIPICCEGVQLSGILENLPARRGVCSIKYLGLPLSTVRLKAVDFQPLLDKIAAKLSGWSGRNMTTTGRLTVVKLVLTAQPVYLLSTLKAPKEIMKSIDAKR